MPERTMAVEPYLRTSRLEAKTAKKHWKIPAFELPRELFAWETVGSILAVILLAQLKLMGELLPFGLALWAVAARDETRRLLLYGLVLAAAAVLFGDSMYVFSLLAGMVAFFLLRFQLQRMLRLRSMPLVVTVGIAFVFSQLPQIITYIQPYDLILSGLELILAVLGAAVFIQVYQHPLTRLHPPKHIEAFISWIIFIGLLLLAMVQEHTVLIYAAGGIAKFVVLWASFCFGPGLAAAAGAMLGFLLGVQEAGFQWIGVLTFAGFFAGLFRSYGRLAAAVAFLLGTAALSVYDFGWNYTMTEMAVSAAAAGIFLLVPVFPKKIHALLPMLTRQAVNEGEKVRELTAVRIHDYGLVFRELADAFLQAAVVDKEVQPPGVTLAEGLVERVCSKCPSRQRCWEKDVKKTYNALLRIIGDLENGQRIGDIRPPDYIQTFCCKKEELLTAISCLYDIETSGQAWRQRLEENRKVVTTQLAGLSQIMIDLAKDVREGLTHPQQKIKNQFFHVELGIAQAAKGNQEICGDYYSYLELRDGKQAFILSDGMGNGSRARQESRSAVQLVEQLLLAGFRKDAVVRTVNTILQLRSHDETFATLDVLLIDTEKGEAEFLKTGAAPSYLRENECVKEIQCAAVPLGILNEVELKTVHATLEDDSLIVMVTDGVFEAAPRQPDWLKHYLARQTRTHPQILADEILDMACRLYGSNELRDDLTVLVCRAKRLKHKIRDYMTA